MQPDQEIIRQVNESPLFTRIVRSLEYDRVGLQLHRNGNVETEWTNYLADGQLKDVEEGLHDPAFVIRVDLETWDRINTPEEVAWMRENPLAAVRKYWKHIEIPLRVKLKIGVKLLGD